MDDELYSFSRETNFVIFVFNLWKLKKKINNEIYILRTALGCLFRINGINKV